MYTHTGVVKRRWGIRFGEAHHPLSLYRCRDGWISSAPRCPTSGSGSAPDDGSRPPRRAAMAPAVRFERADEIDAPCGRGSRPSVPMRPSGVAGEPCAGGRADFVEVLQSEHRRSATTGTVPWLGADARMPAAPFRVGDAACVPARSCAGPGHGGVPGGAPPTERRPFPRIDLTGGQRRDHGRVGRTARRAVARRPRGRRHQGRAPTAGACARRRRRTEWHWGTCPPQVRAAVFPDAEPGEHPWNRRGLLNKMNRNRRGVCLDAKAAGGARCSTGSSRSRPAGPQLHATRAASLGVDPDRVAPLNAHWPPS